MKFQIPISVKEIASKIGATIIGNDTLMATGINEIHKVTSGDITFSDVKKYFDKSIQSAATIIILNEAAECPEGKAILICDAPFDAYNSIIKEHRPFFPLTSHIHESAKIHPSTIIEPNVVIGNNVEIGENCHIQANVVIREYTVIKNNVTIMPNTVIGQEAFYYKKHETHRERWRSGGRVVIEDHVDIGPSCTISKGVSGDTIIGEGTKLDGQIHIGHGAVVGKNCLFAAHVGVGGKTIIEDDVTLYGQVGLAHNIVIGKGATVLAKSGVSKSLEGGKTYFGTPATEIRQQYRELAALRKLPEIISKLKKDS